MSIIAKTGVGAEAYRKEKLQLLKNFVDEVGKDMMGQPLNKYDWVLVVGTDGKSVQKRIGFVLGHTEKKTTIMVSDMCGWRYNGEVGKTSVYSCNLLKIDESQLDTLEKYGNRNEYN